MMKLDDYLKTEFISYITFIVEYFFISFYDMMLRIS